MLAMTGMFPAEHLGDLSYIYDQFLDWKSLKETAEDAFGMLTCT